MRIGSTLSSIDIDRDAAHAAAQRELVKAIYRANAPSKRFRDFIDEMLLRLVAEGSSIPGGWFTITVLFIVLAGVGVAAIRVARRTMRTNRRGDHQLFGPTGLSAAEHRAAAQRYAANNDWPAAIRHGLRAVARELEETGVVNSAPGRTANELARDAGAVIPHLAHELTRSADVFDDVAYGERPGTPAAYRMITDLDDHLRSRPVAGPAAMTNVATSDEWTPIR